MMLRTWRKPRKLFGDFNTLQFACVMSLVVFVLLLVFLTNGGPSCRGTSTDLPKVNHPVFMPGAYREDAMIVNITRDGKVYFGSDQVRAVDLPQRIADRLKDRSVERKIYIKTDMRAMWGAVKPALDGVRSAGILRIAFLVDERQSAAVHL